MPSHLRIQSNFGTEAHATYHTTTAQRPTKKAKMSLTQTYYVASAARSKLGKEAARPEEPRRVQWMDSIAEDEDDAESDDESDDGSDLDEEEMFALPTKTIKNAPVTISSDDAEYDEDEE